MNNNSVKDKYKLSLVIPCFNEAENIPPLVAEITEILEEFDYEIILVDDGSTDQTRQVCQLLSEEDRRVKYLFIA